MIRPSDYIFAEDAEVRLQFDGYDEEKYESGYTLAYYTGSFRLVGKDGKTYIARFMQQLCYSGNYDQYEAGNTSYEGMYDEDPDFGPWTSVEKVLVEHGFDIQTPMYNIMGVQVDPSYKGIVIQNGKKLLLQ